MTTRIFALVTGRPATRRNNGLIFSLEELLPDEGGDVVIDDNTRDITILTDDRGIARGVERDHVTRTGDDVSGFAYCRLANGITVFYPRSHSLCIDEREQVRQGKD